jgi:hypothetical protein
MEMQNLLELNLGYVTCDICGEGYNGIGVWYDEWAPADTPYRVIRKSKCYGSYDKDGLTKGEAVELLETSAFMVATRPARRQFNSFLGKFRRGRIELPAPTVVGAQLTTAAPTPYEPCTCEECLEVEANYFAPSDVRPYVVSIDPGMVDISAPVTWVDFAPERRDEEPY